MLGRAQGAEGGTLVGLEDPLQYQAALALRWLFHAVSGQPEALLRVELRVRRAQTQAALRDFPDPPPAARHHLEDFRDQPPRLPVALAADGPGILVFHLRSTLFQLPHAEVGALQDVQRLEAG